MTTEKNALLLKLEKLGLTPLRPGYSPPLPLVSLEEFFNGNDDQESIAVNLLAGEPSASQHPGLKYFFETLKEIRSRTDVDNVMVEVLEIETALASPTAWPFAEKVFFFTSAPKGEVEAWAKRLKADGVLEGNNVQVHSNEPKLSPGSLSWCCIWD